MPFHDLRIAGRILRKNPVFSLTAALTIALGVGASTAIFSVANAILIQPLPYKDSGRLVVAGMELRKRNVRDLPFSNADFIDLREGTRSSLKDLAGVFTFSGLMKRQDGTTEQSRIAVATTNFFRVTGGRIVLGRDFNDDDGVPQPAPPPPGSQAPPPARLPVMAILSYEYLQQRFGGNPNALGQTLPTAGGPGFVVVGVVQPGFHLYFPPDANIEPAPDIWIANRLAYDAANRKNFSIRPVGRLKDGATVAAVRAAAEGIAATARMNIPLDESVGYHIGVEPLQQHLVREARPAVLALMGSVIFLLLIACANVANLLLVRAGLRERELAVRAALGAARWRLVRPLLVEAFLLGALGTAVGLVLAWAGIHGLHALAPSNLPRLEAIGIDSSVLVFTALSGMAAAAIFGLAPAWRASRPVLIEVLHGAGRSAGFSGSGLLRNVVVMTEVALAFVLLIGSGLMFRSFLELQRIDPGFDPHHLLSFQVLGVGALGQKPEQRAALVRQMKEKLGAIPGVQSVTASFPFPLTGDFSPIRWGTQEALSDPSKFQAADFQIVLPGYFETMRTPLLAGRTFTEDDNFADRNRVIIDEQLAAKAFRGQSAVGKRILIRLRTPEAEQVEVIGVVAHQRTASLSEAGREQVYFTDGFADSGAVRSWAIRTGSDAESYAGPVRAAMREIEPHLLVRDIESMDAAVYRAQASTRFSLLLITLFALIAGALAGVGLYGVLSTAVRQRTSEIGVRMALGAGRANIFQLVVRQGLILSAVGVAAGLIAALALTRMMSAMLVGVKPTDPATFAAMTLMFFFIAALASWLPARRAAGLDPMTALREQ